MISIGWCLDQLFIYRRGRIRLSRGRFTLQWMPSPWSTDSLDTHSLLFDTIVQIASKTDQANTLTGLLNHCTWSAQFICLSLSFTHALLQTPCQHLYGNEGNFLISPALHNDTEYHLRMKKLWTSICGTNWPCRINIQMTIYEHIRT